MSQHLWLVFTIGTAVCWGAYGPSIHEGQAALKSAWKAFLLVGGAYFVLAVLVPLVMILRSEEENFQFPARGTAWAGSAGALGALGALFVIAAMKNGGRPLYVMPLVFGLAPVVNVIVSSVLHPPKSSVHPMLFIGLAVLATGAGIVLYFKPT